MKATIRLATRESALALWQTRHVADLLRAAHPGLSVELVPMTTRGDQILDRPLAEIGGKGLFLKELEVAMLEDRADAAVHSLKDVPMQLEGPFSLPAVLERADPFDALVSNAFGDLGALPEGARVGTSSQRRQAQLRALRPDLRLIDLRGNLQTRLRKLDEGEYDAIVLAAAGLERLGLAERIAQRLLPPLMLPAVAQGALAIEAREGDQAVADLLQVLEHPLTRICVVAERAMNARLGGSCHVAVAGHARIVDSALHLHGLVGDPGDGRTLRADVQGDIAAPAALGERVAQRLLDQGAAALLDHG